MKDGAKPGELSYEQVAALKDVKDMTVDIPWAACGPYIFGGNETRPR